jgi:hypothetical protein
MCMCPTYYCVDSECMYTIVKTSQRNERKYGHFFRILVAPRVSVIESTKIVYMDLLRFP